MCALSFMTRSCCSMNSGKPWSSSSASSSLAALSCINGTAFPGTDLHPGFIEALYDAFAMLFFANELPFPEQLGLQILFFLIPILGLSTLAEGLVRFSIALTDKRARRREMAGSYGFNL